METDLEGCERAMREQRKEMREMRREFERVNGCVMEAMGDRED